MCSARWVPNDDGVFHQWEIYETLSNCIRDNVLEDKSKTKLKKELKQLRTELEQVKKDGAHNLKYRILAAPAIGFARLYLNKGSYLKAKSKLDELCDDIYEEENV